MAEFVGFLCDKFDVGIPSLEAAGGRWIVDKIVRSGHNVGRRRAGIRECLVRRVVELYFEGILVEWYSCASCNEE